MLRLALITDKENQTYVESQQMAVEVEICWSIQQDLTMTIHISNTKNKNFRRTTLKICLSMQYKINIAHKLGKDILCRKACFIFHRFSAYVSIVNCYLSCLKHSNIYPW